MDGLNSNSMLRKWSTIALILLGFVSFAAADDTAVPTAKLDRDSVPARGQQSALLTVTAFGRYAVMAASEQGVALQSVDHMTGAGAINGEAGKQDGRLDLFLDRGDYKIVTRAAANGKGKVALKAHAYTELNPRVPLLVEHRLESASLADFQQRSYWIEVKEKRIVTLEAAGRHLADLRLWRDGTWLVDAVPQLVQSQARVEQPLQIARLSVELAPGLYVLTAYGGASQSWTEASDHTPFFLRFGIPTLAPAMRQQYTMSEFGTDRYLVPAGPTFFRLELPSAQAASLQVGVYDKAEPFKAKGQSASIDKRSVPPVAELTNEANQSARVVTISMGAGKPFVLQHFEAGNVRTFDKAGNYWISSIHAGSIEDGVGATGILTRSTPLRREEYVNDQVVEISRVMPWRRKFNLLGELTLFIKVAETSKIIASGQGVKARYRFEPFLTSHAADYKSPPWRDNDTVFELDRGLHVLHIAPDTKGILDLSLMTAPRKPGAAALPISPVSPAVRFSPTSLDRNTLYTLYLNRDPGVTSGILLRSLPIDLSDALPIFQQAGEKLRIPVVIAEKGTLRALAEDSKALDIAIEDGKSGSAIDMEAGSYHVLISASLASRNFALRLDPLRLASTIPLAPLPDARVAGLPKFPVITPEAPAYLDLGKTSTAEYNVRVSQPGFYQFESTGLLRTAGLVRTRITTSLFAEAENGIGSNFMIQRYLRQGDYQLGVSVQGATRGPLGVQLTRTDVIDGGELHTGEVARALLPSSQALAYRFRVRQRGTYHLQTLGLGRNFDIRLEDAGGWPVLAPVHRGDVTQELAPGDYRVLVLPQTAPARVLTRLDRVIAPSRYKGHGPHRIALESQVRHEWIEPAKGAVREPDEWIFSLPAPAEITITLDSEMEATLARPIAGMVASAVASTTEQNAAPLARFDAAQAWRGRLPAGDYVIRARNSRSNNHVPYTLRIASTELVAGQSRLVSAPAIIPVSVGTDGLIELQSFGATDVRARLLDAAGELVAQNDDRPDDWNFHIAQRLRPGDYKLLVAPLDNKQAQTTVSMLAPEETVEAPLLPGAMVDVKDARVHIYPLQIPPGRNLLLVSAQSSEVAGLALEAQSDDAAQAWVNLGTSMTRAPYLALPLATDGHPYKAYRLRAWSADRRSMQMRVRVAAATLPAVPESNWLHGAVAPVTVDDALPRLRIAMVGLSGPGTFRVKGDLGHLRWSDSMARAAQPASSNVISVSGKTLLLVNDDAASGAAAFAAERLQLPNGEPDTLRLELMSGQTGAVDLRQQSSGISLVLAQSRVGQPGLALGKINGTPNPGAVGIAQGEAITIALPGTSPLASVWNAGNQGASLELDLRQVILQQGASRSADFGILDGNITSKTALPVRLSGDPHLVRLTLAPMHAAPLADWFPALQATVIKPPQTIALAGKEQLFELRLEQASMLHLRTSVPVVTQYVVEGQTPQTDAYLFGASINLLAPAGSSRLMLHAVGAESLSGAATLLMTPVTALVDGPGPEILLAPGSARLLSFDVKQRNVVGIGIRASSDVVRGVLYDERGVQQSEGVVQMPTLAPGRYFLLVAMPTDSAPVRVRPILLGLKPADTRPPYDILRRYVESKDGDPILYVPPPPKPLSDLIAQDEPEADTESVAAPDDEEEAKPSDGTKPESNGEKQ